MLDAPLSYIIFNAYHPVNASSSAIVTPRSTEDHLNGVYYFSLLVITIFSLLENVFFVLLTIGPLHRVCYLRRRRRDFVFLTRNNVNIRNLAFSLQITAMGYRLPIATRPGQLKPNGNVEVTNKLGGKQIPQTSRTFPRSRYISTMSTDTSGFSSMHKFTRYFFCSLCVSIILLMFITLLNVLLNGFVKTSNKRSVAFCLLAEISHSALLMVMSFSLVQLTMDRLIALCVPLRYRYLMSTCRCLHAIAIGWSFSVFLAFVPHMHLGFKLHHLENGLKPCFIVRIHGFNGHFVYAYVFMILTYVTPLCFIVFAYIRIHFLVKKSAVVHEENHLRFLNKINTPEAPTPILAVKNQHMGCISCQNAYLEPPTCSVQSSRLLDRTKEANTNSDAGLTQTSQENESRDESSLLMDSLGKERAAKSAMWIVCSFYGLILPYMIVIFYHAVAPASLDSLHGSVDIAESVSIIMAYLSTVITPIIYAVRDGVLRRRLRSFYQSLTTMCKEKRIALRR